jgi:hypothetical protein
MKVQLNSVEEIRKRLPSGAIRWSWSIIMLWARTLLFFLFGFVILFLLNWLKVSEPTSDVTRWWTYQVICANIACSLLWWLRKRWMRFRLILIRAQKRHFPDPYC